MSRPAKPGATGRWACAEGLYFYGGPFSNFASTPGLELPAGWFGHPRPSVWLEVPSVEHYFQACKASCEEDFLWVLDAPTARQAKRRGGPRGESGRRLELRPDWEDVKFDVMRFACRGKYAREPFRELLLETGARTLIEDSPWDYVWGGRDAKGGYDGRNLLGVVLMELRSELRGG